MAHLAGLVAAEIVDDDDAARVEFGDEELLVPELLRRGGFALPWLETAYIHGPRPMSFTYWGAATPD